MERQPTTNPQIDGEPMSFVRLGSRVARFHDTGDKFTDTRGIVAYDFRKDGSLRALTKPRSRVKRLREARG